MKTSSLKIPRLRAISISRLGIIIEDTRDTTLRQTITRLYVYIYMYIYTIYSVIIIEYIIPLVEMMGRLDW